MLYDKTKFAAPSLESFSAFVKAKTITSPNGFYCWSFAERCAVGQYLHSRGWDKTHNWYNHRDGLLDQMDDLARGPRDKAGRMRDKNGKFTPARSQWTWTALSERIDKALVCE